MLSQTEGLSSPGHRLPKVVLRGCMGKSKNRANTAHALFSAQGTPELDVVAFWFFPV